MEDKKGIVSKKSSVVRTEYDTVIGLEVHIELSTKTKIFCGCSTKFGALPNTQTCPVCTGMPGSLPVLNKAVVESAIALGLATNCTISRRTLFDRKNYFYPDNPQNYQISQLYAPICKHGYLTIEALGSAKIRIHEMHMEEDAGKLTHIESCDAGEHAAACSLVDYNRSGVPLIEIVSEPDLSTAEEVIAYLEKLRMICLYLGISDCKLQEGSMRVDVNLSVKKAGSPGLGTRTEMKNLNSFKAITRAIAAERERQIALLEAGGEVVQETRRWDDGAGVSFPMRSKEDSKDYRYFPEPDLPPVMISEEWIEKLRKRQPEFQEEKALRFQTQYKIPAYDAQILTQSAHLAQLFEETAQLSGQPKKTANWFMGELLRVLKEMQTEPEKL
ncbi:MAG: Asp-tRNA(Asn)/Glu-tRNA(Gln) amidotransferase subunit GatB, partial [Lachnospiraceae bacterium]